ncbi:MAG: phosphoadenosine phosphosulfate reductase family protein [Thermoplasmatota archaeon]
MSIIRLGKLHLHWCKECNIPLVEEGKCGTCSSESEQVKITPPGDVRPAFSLDRKRLEKTIDHQWGESYYKELFGKREVILLNNSPHIDRMDEVIIDGHVVGNLRYNIFKRAEGKEPYEFLIRPWKNMPKPKKGFVIVDDGAVKPILNGASILAPGIIEVDENIETDDEVLILDKQGDIIAAGSAQMDASEILESDYGKSVKNRWRVSDFTLNDTSPDWDTVLKANEHLIDKRVIKAVNFIRDKTDKTELPTAVAYSGGKDSLAALHLVMDAGIKPDLMFINTGIELPETVENVKNIAEKYDLNLFSKRARSGYWDNVDHFGPSARDYRWCCKTCKLGPTALLINEEYPDGVLSFIGQRRYESEQRKDKGSTWNNPWVPGQRSASPIQDWTALHIWMYLFLKDADYNPLYENGFERIGCWVCPASDIEELETLKERFEGYNKFGEVLEEYRNKAKLPEVWKELGLWRWNDVPKEMEILLDRIDENYTTETPSKEVKPSISEMMEDQRTRNLLNIILPKEIIETYNNSKISEFKGKLEERGLSHGDIYEIYIKARYCAECGICVARCPNDAIKFQHGIYINTEKCNSCRTCLGKCPVVEFDARVIYPE